MKGKIIVPLLLASLSSGVVAATRHQYNVSADNVELTNLVGSLVEITDFSSTGSLGDKIYLPNVIVYDELGVATGEELVEVIIDPSGRTLLPTEIEQEEVTPGVFRKYYEPKIKGYYSLSYATDSNTQLNTVTNPLKIYVSALDYSISLPTNSEHVIPSTIPSTIKGETTVLKIPAPVVYLGEEEVTNPIESGEEGLKVYVVAKDSGDISSASALTTYNAEGNYFTWSPTITEGNDGTGVYEIIYKYVKGTVQDYKTQRFVVKTASEYDISKINLNFSYASSRPSSATLGVGTILPKINIVNKTTGNTIEGHTSIKIEHIAANGTATDVTATMLEDYEFIPTLKGQYRVTYKATLSLFDNLESNTHTFLISDVKDSVAPSVLPVNSYVLNEQKEIIKVTDKQGKVLFDVTTLSPTISEEDKEELITKALGNVKYNVPSVVALKPVTQGEGTVYRATVEIPAIWGLDNFSDYSGLTFKRSIRKSSNGVVTEVTGYSANEVALHTIETAGDYTIRYIVTDEAGNEKMSSYSLKVVDSEASLKEEGGNFYLPKIQMQALSAYINGDAKITFNAPTATDEFDSSVEVKTFYYFDSPGEEKEITETNAAGQLVLNLADVTVPPTAKVLYVKAYAYNDYATDNEGDRIASTVIRQINLINTSDQVAPEFVNINQFLDGLTSKNNLDTEGVIDVDGYLYDTLGGTRIGEPFNQKDLITLPTVTVTDTLDPNLELSVTIKDPFGKNATLLNSKFTKNTTSTLNTYTVGDGSFVANYSGVYTVTYTARDAGGNIIIKTFGIRVRDTEKPSILLSSFDPFVNEVQVGAFIEVPAATLKDNGLILDDIAYGEKYEINPVTGEREPGTGVYKPGISWRLAESSNVMLRDSIGFTPLAAGNYVVIYEGWDKNGNTTESKAYTVVAKDTIKPTIEIEKDFYLPTAVPYVENQPITLPGVIELYDGFRDKENSYNNYDQTPIGEISLTVKVTDSNGTNITVEEDLQETNGGVPITRYYFTPTGNAVYTIKYSATDNAGNTTEITKSLEVGDVNAPELTWKDDYSIITSATIGDSFELNMSKAAISDDNDSEDYIKIDVYMYDPSDKLVEKSVSSGYKWKFENVGTYEIKIILTDSANNKQTYTYNIVVSEEETKTEIISPWLGTTLIVGASVILAGVVIYFIVTGRDGKIRKGGKRKPAAKKK